MFCFVKMSIILEGEIELIPMHHIVLKKEMAIIILEISDHSSFAKLVFTDSGDPELIISKDIFLDQGEFDKVYSSAQSKLHIRETLKKLQN